MEAAGVDRVTIRDAIADMNTYRVLPFRFIAAARHAPHLESDLEKKFIQLAGEKKLPGRTIILVDVSGSMSSPLSGKSDMNRIDAAAGVAMVGREMSDDVEVFTFENRVNPVQNRHGFALRDAIGQPRGGTMLGSAIAEMNQRHYDRLIVVTDEQSHDAVGSPKGRGYIINVASNRNGVGYGKWTHIDGFSEAIFGYIIESEQELE